MKRLEEMRVTCPYCGAGFITLIDDSAASQQYIEDCRACCSPIEFFVSVCLESGQLRVRTQTNDE